MVAFNELTNHPRGSFSFNSWWRVAGFKPPVMLSLWRWSWESLTHPVIMWVVRVTRALVSVYRLLSSSMIAAQSRHTCFPVILVSSSMKLNRCSTSWVLMLRCHPHTWSTGKVLSLWKSLELYFSLPLYRCLLPCGNLGKPWHMYAFAWINPCSIWSMW